MKYFIYISEPKIDMLLDQIPHAPREKVVKEVKTDLKLFSATRKAERDVDQNRIEKLETVVQFLLDYADVGDVDNPGEYIADALQMKWGPYGMRQSQSTEVVYFGGQTEYTIVGLGGSARNILGSAGTSPTHSYSVTPTLLFFLENECAQATASSLMEAADRAGIISPEARGIRAVSLATARMHGPLTHVEFVAKRLLFAPDATGKNVLLASPLYVALRD